MKGIFCLEGFWIGDHRSKTTVVPVLELMHGYQGMPYVHHRCGSKDEFVFSIGRWKTKSFHKKYPFLFLAFHGEQGHIRIGSETVSIEELGVLLEDKCAGTVIYFGSCATMKWNKRFLQNFMERTQTLAVLGYKDYVEWLPSASFEIRLLSYFQEMVYTTDGIHQVKEQLVKDCRPLLNNLKFRFEINERLRITPKTIRSIPK